MEAGSITPEGRARVHPPAPDPLRHAGRQIADFLGFCGRALLALTVVWRYTAEVLRQVGILVIGTTLVTLFLMFVIGGVCGTFGAFSFRAIGASDAVGVQNSLCVLRGSVALMMGYVLAAKVGCGLVAEIGSMETSDELEAFRSVGLDPMVFVVATRVAAMILYLPLLWAVSQLTINAGVYFTVVVMIGEVSQGSWETLHWGLQSVQGLLFSFVSCMVIGVVIVLVATFYGYTVRGGPAEVGAATARSMVVNLVLVHVLYAILTVIFYGGDPRLPIGG